MLKWIAKLMGDTPIEIPAGVPEVWVQRIESLLAPLGQLDSSKVRAGLPQDILGYVLHGQPAAVLREVEHSNQIAQPLGLLGYHLPQSKDTNDVYEHFNAVPPSIALRWAHVLVASVVSQTTARRGLAWPQVLLMHCAGVGLNTYYGHTPQLRHLSALQMEALLQEAGIEPNTLYVGAFTNIARYGSQQDALLLTSLVGYAEALERHLESIRTVMLPAEVPQRLHVLAMLAQANSATLDQLLPQLCELATSGSKQVRLAAEPLLHQCSAAVFAPLQSIATEAKPDRRAFALDCIFKLANARNDQAMMAWARQTAGADKAASVQALPASWAVAQEVRATSKSAPAYTIPTIDWSAGANPIPSALLDTLWRNADELLDKRNAEARTRHANRAAQGHTFPLNQIPAFAESDRKQLQAYLTSDAVAPPERQHHQTREHHIAWPCLQSIAETDGITPLVMFKLLRYFDLLVDNAGWARGMLSAAAGKILGDMHSKTGRPSLLELSAMMDGAGYEGRNLLRNYCHGWGRPFAADWPNEDVWPFFDHHMDWVLEVMTNNTIKDYTFERKGLFRALATLPELPPAAIHALFNVALGSGKTERGFAQDALQSLTGKEVRIAEALNDGKSETRMLAAQWLGRLRHTASIPALEKAVRKEKQDLAKGAMLDSLQLMGQPIEKYLDRDALAVEATKSLSKGVPKELEWFPWSSLPTVHWADGRGSVPTEVLKWMLAQAVKQKQPEPNAVLRKYCAMFHAVDREALGQYVLESWLREDVRPITPEQAERMAQSSAQSTHASMSQYPQYYQNSPSLGKSVEELAAAYLPGLLRQPEGSAIGSKGLLAVAAACASEQAVAPTQRYLKEWYGMRPSQGKSLITMLAWIEHPSATQLMLSIGTRFRTRSFQEEAIRQAELLAERKGWTLAELADRTVPTAGFDDNGVLELDYGPRQFTARLLPDFKVELFNPDGKKISALPEPRQDDDAEAAKQAKKALSAAKKELKSIVDLQTDRFYEALCIEREWLYEDWATYLFAHPVLRHLVQRLVWMQVDEGKTVQIFRPLDDGSLTDCEDNAATIPAGSRVRLAHDSLLQADAVSAWQQHLVDYEIKPLFQQLGKGRYVLPPDLRAAEEVDTFRGHMLESFALRGRALKLGYFRGPAEDGGWFHVYEKRFPTLGLQASIEFTGSPLPEENRSIALQGLWFTPTQAADVPRAGKVMLSKVPSVLLSECYNDMRLIAAEGSGFDPEWQKKSEY